MKPIVKNILIGILALLFGLTAGYFIFSNREKTEIEPEEKINTQNDEKNSLLDEVWTCSMHPQVRQNEPGLCPICEMDLIPLDFNTSNDPLILKMTKESAKLANIQTSVVQESNKDGAATTIKLSGKVKSDERLASSQVAHIPGRIEKLFVTFTGEKVKKGQKLASIYSPNLISAQRELLEAIKLKEINPGLLKAAQNKLKYWKLGNDFIESLEKEQIVKETFTLFAEKSGIVTNKRVAVGDYVKQGEALFDLMNLSKVWVIFDAYEGDLPLISINDEIKFTTPSLPNKTFKTRVSFIDPLINPITRVASIRTEVSNKSGSLKPEMFVNGLLNNASGSNVLLSVPKTAVLWTGTRSVVYVKVPDSDIPSFEYREIELGENLGNKYQVLSGIEKGEEVVTYGNFTIDAAAQLNNQASMMNTNVSLKKETNNHKHNYNSTTPEKFKMQITELAVPYIKLKDSFVNTDSREASSASKEFNIKLEEVDMNIIEGEAHLFWKEQLGKLKKHSAKISELEDVEAQRKHFYFLSEALISVFDSFGTSGKQLFVQYCPMALNNEGADWISSERQIQNPYFGDKMLKCGAVKRDLSKPNLNLE